MTMTFYIMSCFIISSIRNIIYLQKIKEHDKSWHSFKTYNDFFFGRQDILNLQFIFYSLNAGSYYNSIAYNQESACRFSYDLHFYANSHMGIDKPIFLFDFLSAICGIFIRNAVLVFSLCLHVNQTHKYQQSGMTLIDQNY